MPYRITFVLGERSDAALGILLGCLTEIDAAFLRAHPEVPLLRSAGVSPATHHPSDWQDIPRTLENREGNLATLSCWQNAEHAKIAVRTGGTPQTVLLNRLDPVLEHARQTGRIPFQLNLFNGPEDRALSDAALETNLWGLVSINELYLRAHPEAPLLYNTRVRYREEPAGLEDWCDIPTVLGMGIGDCEDVACYRTAELRVRFGINARPLVSAKIRDNGSYLFHIRVLYPDGRIEDPSRRLGME